MGVSLSRCKVVAKKGFGVYEDDVSVLDRDSRSLRDYFDPEGEITKMYESPQHTANEIGVESWDHENTGSKRDIDWTKLFKPELTDSERYLTLFPPECSVDDMDEKRVRQELNRLMPILSEICKRIGKLSRENSTLKARHTFRPSFTEELVERCSIQSVSEKDSIRSPSEVAFQERGTFSPTKSTNGSQFSFAKDESVKRNSNFFKSFGTFGRLWTNSALTSRLKQNIKRGSSNALVPTRLAAVNPVGGDTEGSSHHNSICSVASHEADPKVAMLDFMYLMAGQLDVEALLVQLGPQVCNFASVEHCLVWAVNRSTNEIRTCTASSPTLEPISLPLDVHSVVGRVAVTGKIVMIENAYEDTRFNPAMDIQMGYRTRNMLCVPIFSNGQRLRSYDPEGSVSLGSSRIMGVVQLVNKDGGDQFDDEDVEVMKYVQKLVAVCLRNALQYEALVMNERRKQVILDVTNELACSVHSYKDCTSVISQYQGLIGAERASLYVVDEATNELQIFSETEHLNGRRLPLFPAGQAGIAGHVALTGEEVVVLDSHMHPNFDPILDETPGYKTRQMVCMPIKLNTGKVVGVLQLINKKETYQSETTDLSSPGDSGYRLCSCGNSLCAGCLGRRRKTPLASFTPEDLKLIHALNVQVAVVFNKIEHQEHQQQLREVEEEKRQLLWQEEMANQLLTTLIPVHIVNQLKESGEVSAESHSRVTVLFSDIVGFTAFSSSVPPDEVLVLLNDMFSLFDNIVVDLNVFKVETIGDAYMAVSGLDWMEKDPEGRSDAYLMVLLANQMLKAVQQMKPRSNNFQPQVRIGIHTGSLMAGVVGETMPRYHLFGDTVNTASRVESNGVAGKIQMSSVTAHLLLEEGVVELKEKEDNLSPLQNKTKSMTQPDPSRNVRRKYSADSTRIMTRVSDGLMKGKTSEEILLEVSQCSPQRKSSIGNSDMQSALTSTSSRPDIRPARTHFTIQSRGQLDVKGKGQMDMFIVEELPELKVSHELTRKNSVYRTKNNMGPMFEPTPITSAFQQAIRKMSISSMLGSDTQSIGESCDRDTVDMMRNLLSLRKTSEELFADFGGEADFCREDTEMLNIEETTRIQFGAQKTTGDRRLNPDQLTPRFS